MLINVGGRSDAQGQANYVYEILSASVRDCAQAAFGAADEKRGLVSHRSLELSRYTHPTGIQRDGEVLHKSLLASTPGCFAQQDFGHSRSHRIAPAQFATLSNNKQERFKLSKPYLITASPSHIPHPFNT